MGHSPQLDDPAAVARAISDFIASAAPAFNSPDRWADVLTEHSAASAAGAAPLR
jgi:hypothetical protein